MKKIILSVVVFGMIGWAFFDLLNSTDESTKIDTEGTVSSNEGSNGSDVVGIQRGEIAPDFELTTLNGENVKLSDYRGTKVFINFWATWCPPCRAEMPDMERVYQELDNLEILAVNLTGSEKSEEAVSEFVQDYGLSFPILMDRNYDVSDMYQVHAYPTSYLIDSEGRIQFIATGAMNHDTMMKEIEKMK